MLFNRSYSKMNDSAFGPAAALKKRKFSIRVILSYALDWIIIVAVAGVAVVLGHLEPIKRPFSLVDPLISFPFTEKETVPPWLLLVCNAAIPIVIIAIVSLIFVPGPTVPKDTPKALIWQRKLWELHAGWQGLALALVSAWFFTESMKNMFGKPRPDMLDRCEPDIENWKKYIVGGGIAWQSMTGQLVSADICQQKDAAKLNDGFRSYPSGHSSSAAAGLIYTSLFLASKFAVTIPYVLPSSLSTASEGHSSRSAFPSRMHRDVDPYEPSRTLGSHGGSGHNSPENKANPFSQPAVKIQSLRRQAATPPIYLLAITLVPFCLAVFIASSRWFDFRHHGFDILFGFLMGTLTSIYAFRFYHLPMRAGAGWAWGPRSEERAFWAGVGRHGYAGGNEDIDARPTYRETDFGESGDNSYPSMTSGALTQRPIPTYHQHEEGVVRAPSPQEVEMDRLSERGRNDDRPLDSSRF